ncbi:MAG: hypothetical protein WA667_28215 [Candidatus Nitrosopolaris sp.]
MLGILLDTGLTERKRGQNKPIRQATKDYRNSKNDSENNKTIDTKKKTKKISTEEKQEPFSLKRDQATTPSVNEFIPEVFGSSSYDDVSEMKDSASIQEDDLKNAISNVQKNEPIKTEVSVHPNSHVNPYLQSVNPITIMQERTSIIGESGEMSSYEKRRSNDDNPFMSSVASWQSGMISWIGIYKDFSENVAKMVREYWMTPFWISRSEYKTSEAE